MKCDKVCILVGVHILCKPNLGVSGVLLPTSSAIGQPRPPPAADDIHEQPPTNSAVYCSSFIYWQGVRFLYSPSRVMQQIPFEPPAWPPAWLGRFCTLTGQCLFRSAANHCFRIRQHVVLKGSKLIFVFFICLFLFFALINCLKFHNPPGSLCF